ncbi:MAG: hypothetical protein ACI8Z1_002648 [Candidatus Azotimanducaceae bacterium]
MFKGDIVEGFDSASVQAHLSKLLKIDAKKTASLFSGKQIVLKKTADKAAAAKYGKALKKVGADVKIKIIRSAVAAPVAAPTFAKAQAPVFQKSDDIPAFQKADDAPEFQTADVEPKPKTAAIPSTGAIKQAAPIGQAAAINRAAPIGQAAALEPASAAAIDTSGITIAPNEGDLFDPEPATESPDLDLSQYEVAENDGSLLVPPSEEITVDIDLSAFSVKDNDGTPLVEASAVEVPKVEAPDFGLDEPGAILETIQEEKELLNPNTMGMTLAMVGSDMIEEDEKPLAPPPVSPDTSKINLVTNFDI